MTIQDSTPDGFAIAQPLSDAFLLARFQALSIDKSPDICEEDDVLTDEKILAVYQKLLVDLRALVVAVAANASLGETNLPALFQNAFFGLCSPYRKALKHQQREITQVRAERGREITEVRAERDREITEVRAERDRVRAEIDLHRAKMDTLRAEVDVYRAKMDTLQAEKEKTQAEMDTLRAVTAKDVANLRADQSEEMLEVTKEMLEAREEMLEAREETIEAAKEMNTTLLDRLHRPILQVCVPDSVSRRETWEKVKAADGTELDKILPDYPDRKITNKLTLPLVSADFIDEAAMYAPVTKLVTEQLTVRRTKNHPGTKVFDTHNRYFLEGQAPDISITVQDVADVDSASVVAIIELKHKSKNQTAMASESFGQVYDYLRKLARAQPNRRKIVGLLSDLTHNHIVIHESPNHYTVNILHFATVGFAKALRFLKYCILHDSDALPSIPSFSADLHILQMRLGNPVFSVVGVFSIPANFPSTNRWLSPEPLSVGDQMVVKRTSNVPPRRPRASLIQAFASVRSPQQLEIRPVAAEIKILQAIRKAGGSEHLPKLIYHSTDMHEFGITPLGQPCNIFTMNQSLAFTILKDILTALEWLHSKNIIHRDVRWDNIVVVGGRGVLIDFGAAIINDGRLHDFQGGIVCAPSRVIGQFDRQYLPSPVDDCLAWVLLLNALLAPTRWAGIRSDEIMTEGSDSEKRMRELWRGLEASKVWGPGVVAAKGKRYVDMALMLDVLVLL